jgi:hypothetical protein
MLYLGCNMLPSKATPPHGEPVTTDLFLMAPKLAVVDVVFGAITAYPPKPHRPNPFVGAHTRTHSIMLTLSSLLCVKRLT